MQGAEMMCGARLFTRAVKFDFTEHRQGAVCAQRANVIERVCFVERNFSSFPDDESLS